MSTYTELGNFMVQDSDDLAKQAPELVCLLCDDIICDVEHGDTLNILAQTAMDHAKNCAGPGDDTDTEF